MESEQRTLVLTAFPAEADAILARTTLDENPVVVEDGRHYYLGTLGGKKVIVAMTSIGMANGPHETALSQDAVVVAAGGCGRSPNASLAAAKRRSLRA